ncbi:MAG: XTP/dITP diphosphatase [Armatimonadetes bacterium]|nr:XTP/dITP diphosphatase [Armatimonadota bacterium]
MRRLVIATTNRGKAGEIGRMLSGLNFEITTLADYPPMPEPEETAETFTENAVTKAQAAANHTGELALADDSGLVVDALGGAPGVYSSRFAEDDPKRIAKVLDLMKDVPDSRRTARFVAAVAVAEPGRIIDTVEGVCEGTIFREPRGTHGFGYDPIFLVNGINRTMAELPPEEKNRISHRARAIEAAKRILEGLI